MEQSGYEIIYGPPHLTRIAEKIYLSLLSKYTLEELMAIVKKNRNYSLFILATRRNPRKVNVIIDIKQNYRYSSEDPMFIPIPKKFAILEPDKNYFEITLRTNILLAVLRADEKELHR
jgi:hypothetical protein